jgi:hypothetical protein
VETIALKEHQGCENEKILLISRVEKLESKGTTVQRIVKLNIELSQSNFSLSKRISNIKLFILKGLNCKVSVPAGIGPETRTLKKSAGYVRGFNKNKK